MVNKRTDPTRERILDAVGTILMREGGDAVTIAAVAREAGVSKGGLFYHFKSKDLMINGLVERYIAFFDNLITSADDTPGAATRAYLRSAREPGGPANQAILALFAAAVARPSAVENLREHYKRWQRRLDEDGIPARLTAQVRFVVDGLWLADTFDLEPPSTELRGELLDDLDKAIGQ